jgi:hypothetical protein
MTLIDPQVFGPFDMLKRSDDDKRLPPDEQKRKKAEREEIKAGRENSSVLSVFGAPILSKKTYLFCQSFL